MSRNSTSTAVASKPVAPADRLDTLPLGLPERTLGWGVAAWLHRWLRQPNGPHAGQPFRLTDRQLRFLLWWYALDEQADWLFSHGVRRLAKGSGKSPFVGALSLAEFCGPVRLERFDDRVAGGCRGKPVAMPLVQIAATAESQTANTMRMVRAFAPKGSPLVAEYGLDPGKTRYYRVPEGTLEIITSSASAAEGAESSFVVGDETEHWRPATGGPELAAVLGDNLAKSGSRMVETSNAWVPGAESVAEATWDAWVAQEEGLTRGSTRILYDAVVAPPDTDMSDPVSLRAALEWNYADCWWQNVHPIMERIWRPDSKPDDMKRKYLNWPTVAQDAWTTPQAWAQLTDASIVVADRDEVALFFDGSRTKDATALVGCRLADGHVFVLDVWEPLRDERDVPVEEVDAAVELAFACFDVVAFFADVQEWESFVKLEWPKRYGDRLRVQATTGRDAEPIAWDMRSHVYDFTRAVELCEAEIREGAFTHDGDPRLARHVANARRRPNRYGTSIGKETPSSTRKIDAAVAMIGARMVRRLALAAAPTRKRSGRVWGA